MSSSQKAPAVDYGDAVVIRDEDRENPIAVRFEHVRKTYKLYRNDRERLLASFSNRVKYDTINASDDLTFECRRGEALAFLGDNGAGKSTALKMITGVCFPTAGTIEVHGRVSALLELSAGFDMRLSGMENIRLRCQLWGLSKEESEELIPGITTVAVNRGVGGAACSIHPAAAVREIREKAEASLANLDRCRLTLPDSFEMVVSFKEHRQAYSRSFYPGARLLAPTQVAFSSGDWYEMLRFSHFVLSD